MAKGISLLLPEFRSSTCKGLHLCLVNNVRIRGAGPLQHCAAAPAECQGRARTTSRESENWRSQGTLHVVLGNSSNAMFGCRCWLHHILLKVTCILSQPFGVEHQGSARNPVRAAPNFSLFFDYFLTYVLDSQLRQLLASPLSRFPILTKAMLDMNGLDGFSLLQLVAIAGVVVLLFSVCEAMGQNPNRTPQQTSQSPLK